MKHVGEMRFGVGWEGLALEQDGEGEVDGKRDGEGFAEKLQLLGESRDVLLEVLGDS